MYSVSWLKMRKLTTEDFIEQAKIIHDSKYDYSNTNYIRGRDKIEIICRIHGYFLQKPSEHLRGNGCPKCGIESSKEIRIKKMNQFIDEANKIHNFDYDYSEIKYNGNKIKIKIICQKHGIFLQSPNCHLSGQGCPKCGVESRIKLQTKSNQQFIDEANKIHNFNYDYSEVKYKNAHTRVKIICQKHGIFLQSPNIHLRGQGCPKCGVESRIKLQTKSNQQFIDEASKIHNFLYSYINVKYKHSKDKIDIICKIHDNFLQRPNDHLNGIGCPICCQSKGEIKISIFLNQLNIKYKREYKFNNCKNKKELPFDFYLPDYNLCIEYDGEQHFLPIEIWGGKENLEKIRNNDKIKNKYCEDNNINLLRISYLDIDNIEDILNKNFIKKEI